MDLPEDVIYELRYEIGRNGLEYADNYRAYRCRDFLHYEEFKRRRDRGCCGSFETSIIDKDGEEWIVGCNHGH